MVFPFLHMIIKPPGNRLYIVIPGVLSVITMAIVAGFFQYHIYILRNGPIHLTDIRGQYFRRLIFCWTEKLNNNKQYNDYKQNFFQGFHVMYFETVADATLGNCAHIGRIARICADFLVATIKL